MNGSSRTRSWRTTRTRSSSVLLALSFLALPLLAETRLTAVATRDGKVVRRWVVEGGPRGAAVGANGIIYVGLSETQSLIAVDSKSGTIVKELVLDSAEIAATKELVTMRTNAARTRLYIANGSDESATILAIPALEVIREITLEGEAIRDALPDPKGRYVLLLGRRVHLFDADGKKKLRTLPVEEPMAIAMSSNGATIAVIASQDFGNTKATVARFFDAATFLEIGNEPMQTDQSIEAALFGASDRALVAISRDYLYEKPLIAKPAASMTSSSAGRMRMRVDFGDLVNSERICLPEGAGAQIMTLGPTSDLLLFAERRCSSSSAFVGSNRRITPASLYGVNAYALAYDRESNTLAVTDRAGYLTIYRVPRPAVAK